MKPVEIAFRPVDNQRLAILCGALDENLRQIETALDVSISRRGERFAVNGPPDQTRLAAQVLRAFYEQAKGGLSLEDVQLGLIEATSPRKARAPEGGGPQLITRRQDLHGRTPRQVEYLQNILAHDLTFSIGPAGTGKTYLAVASAVQALRQKRVDRIVLVRPAVEAGENLGFLPGDMQEKVDPYLRPMYDALADLMSYDKMRRYVELGVIEIAPLAFMRGRTLHNSYVILDEAQNTTVRQMKMFLTRMGVNSRAVITGDVTQIDLRDPDSSGLVRIQSILGSVADIKFIYFHPEDVVRHRLVRDIIRAFDTYHSRQNGKHEDGVGTALEPNGESGSEPRAEGPVSPAGEAASTERPRADEDGSPGRGPAL